MHTPLFSVVLATRDRPGLFAQALASVRAQRFADFEIVVVIDGLIEQHRSAYADVLQPQPGGPALRHFELLRRPGGHGQSYALNYGVEQARGAYVCFLDDDDSWCDDAHLARAAAVLRARQQQGRAVDLYMANQHAWRQDRQLPGPIWLEALAAQLQARGRQPDAQGCHEPEIGDLLGCGGFCHLNTLMVRRQLFLDVGGMDENIRWECDRDLFLRLIEAAACIVHHPAVVGHHNVPDPQQRASMTTSLDQVERRLWQLRVLEKAALRGRDARVRAHGHEHKGYVLKRVAEDLARQRQWRQASQYAGQALAVLPTLKWALYTASLYARRLFLRSPERR
jgi:glycosyltransferase involved in cell wall biosynthesis